MSSCMLSQSPYNPTQNVLPQLFASQCYTQVNRCISVCIACLLFYLDKLKGGTPVANHANQNKSSVATIEIDNSRISTKQMKNVDHKSALNV